MEPVIMGCGKYRCPHMKTLLAMLMHWTTRKQQRGQLKRDFMMETIQRGRVAGS